jgi:hypothetical protein
MVETGFVKAGDQMRAAGASGTGADRELARKLGLAGGGERRPFLVAHTDPFDAAAANRVPPLFVSSPRSVKWPGRCRRRDRYATDHRGASPQTLAGRRPLAWIQRLIAASSDIVPPTTTINTPTITLQKIPNS